MAKKRMFNLAILDSDAFLEMPLSAQALYIHLNARADDDGFISNPRRMAKYIGAAEDDLKILLAKRFLIAFEDGVVAVKHWLMHNTIRRDRYTPTVYQEYLQRLGVKDNNAYTLLPECIPNDNQPATKWQPNGNQMATNGSQSVSTGLDIDKGLDIDIDIERAKEEGFHKPTLKEIEDYCRESGCRIDAQHFLDYYDSNGWRVGRSPMEDWRATVRRWSRTEKKSSNKFTNFEQRNDDLKLLEDELDRQFAQMDLGATAQG